jgi:adenylate kinase
MIEDRLSQDDAVDGFVLDGFPRNLAQAQALDAMLSAIGRGLDAILFFDLPEEVALERMRGRGEEEGRGDDTPEAMQRRLEIYRRQTVPVVEHYRATGKLVPLHASRSVDEVTDEIQRALSLFDDAA